ncbi:alanine racemase [Paractinoplanes hotanensis]|uniref:Alanine racemase n=1 Tax=Paractinoplanes hotanensis TaxID=2906497 RepID=A0ABT0Y283_9ACTN|nr:alanine racemase [Actinoplanes hotanensis]MCM4080139.1 alanine racemase [Actinoplanes hotanensis]
MVDVLETAVRHAASLTVDPAAIAANVQIVRSRTRAQVMAVVKADGFGHDAVDVARAALDGGATWLGVTSLAEAMPLREAGLRAPVLSWLNPVEVDVAAAVHHDIDLTVASVAHLDRIAAHGGRARVHLHLDTGLARDGAPPADWDALCASLRRAEIAGHVRVVGVMGHLACADDPADAANRAGRAAFLRGCALAHRHGLRPSLRHLAATAAALTDPASHFELVRVGAGLVGIDPSGRTALRPAMTLTAPVVAVREVTAGTPVGYGHTWRAPRRTTLALVPIGYADGLPRAAVPGGQVLVRGERRPIVGRMSMDQFVVDVGETDVGETAVIPGEVVTVFGPGDAGEPTVADWARWAGTIEHEVVTGVGSRVRRTARELAAW